MLTLDMWQGHHLFSPHEHGEEYMIASEPQPAVEEIRINLLKSLAKAIGHLHTLEFVTSAYQSLSIQMMNSQPHLVLRGRGTPSQR
jgi:hypothetical protein